MTRQAPPPVPARGRPRDPRTRAAILAAARALLTRGGLTSVTIEAIAQNSGVSRPTIYRYWPNAPAVAMAAFLEATGAAEAARSPGNPLAALREQLHALADAFAAPAGRSVAAMVAAAQSETELAKAFRNEFIARNRDATRALLERCITSKEIEAPADMDLTLDLIFGPLFYRLLMGHAPITRDFVDRLFDTVIRARG
ncbi:MAG: TetR/AcrR family transcriptional regulator [Reyranella sp.]|uniref:TetR/AcrR family transcriptional regulator n=1 Tax=Reyranella sp. TaxID=1929291 RepID=UPI00120C2226|nr:TetR/AcrR family transcriptional regulator [Reyranella sp.]TAJ87162.1 MAG: TetR/AcrR family transcriptional regulator [Reyranella sp.]TBR23776.1 MAG: TetR/AcrR family transcriptional regulator [Reyranella sp.]